MRLILRSIGAVLLGFVVASVIMVVIETINSFIFAFPAGVNPNDSAAMNQYFASLPATALIVVLVAWAAGTFAGTFVAARVSGRSHMLHGMLLVVLLLLAGIVQLRGLPSPIWMWVGGIIAFVAFGYAGSRIGAKSM